MSKRDTKLSLLAWLTIAIGGLAMAGGAFTLYRGWVLFRAEFPDVSILRSRYPIVVHRGAQEPDRIQWVREVPPNWIHVADVSKVAVGAVVVSEDWAFYQHKGYDAAQIRDALLDDWGSKLRGASTITQQVVKNVFLTKERSLWRKLKELILAVRLEAALPKSKILEVYLNIAEWGDGIYGIRQAAHIYFGKDPAQLTAKEGAFLAMLLPSPKRYSQSFKSRQLTDYARKSVNAILEKMMQARYITEQERWMEAYQPFSFETSPGASSL